MECIVVSYCLSKDACVDQAKYLFHFKGFFAGHQVKAIKVLTKGDDFRVGQEYIIHLKVEKVEGSTLIGRCIRKKILNELSRDFL